jgi:hypothetical protein
VGRAPSWAVAGLVLAACHRASAPAAVLCCDKSGSTKLEDAGPAAVDITGVDARAAVELPAGPRFRREDGCARDFKPSGSVSRDMAELQRLCAQGMAPLADAVAVAVSGGAAEATFRVVSSGACLRAGAVALSGGVSLSLLRPNGDVLANASSIEPQSVAPIDGTVCVREPGAYRAVVRLLASPTEVSSVTIQVWQAKKEQ